ncbi:Amino acid transporter avt1c [Trifolium repens]|nr:Amino acid transporter avt1c [Trifolium repens]
MKLLKELVANTPVSLCQRSNSNLQKKELKMLAFRFTAAVWYEVCGIELSPQTLFAIVAALAVLPTVMLCDLSILSYISDVGFQRSGTTLNLATLPIAIGLYGYCYSGHAVFPNIYTSMANPNQFPAVLVACFGVCTLLYAGGAFMGYKMFGDDTLSQFTLNLPQDLVATKIAVWTTVVNPFTKYPLYAYIEMEKTYSS